MPRKTCLVVSSQSSIQGGGENQFTRHERKIDSLPWSEVADEAHFIGIVRDDTSPVETAIDFNTLVLSLPLPANMSVLLFLSF